MRTSQILSDKLHCLVGTWVYCFYAKFIVLVQRNSTVLPAKLHIIGPRHRRCLDSGAQYIQLYHKAQRISGRCLDVTRHDTVMKNTSGSLCSPRACLEFQWLDHIAPLPLSEL